MPRMAAKSRRTARFIIWEFLRPAGKLTVDRDAGIIRHVKVLGWTSDNGRRYLPDAVREALPLYEGAKVFTDHPRGNPDHARDDEDAFGRLSGPQLEQDGLYADLHFFKSHPLAETICEDVERGLGVFGLSHNCQADGDFDKGTLLVRRIVEVRSVDVVTESATTKNLWESRTMPSKRRKLKEDDQGVGPLGGMAISGGEADDYSDAPAEMGWEDHCAEMVKAIMSDEGLSPDEKKKKIMAALKLGDAGAEKAEEDDSDAKHDDKVEADGDQEKDSNEHGEDKTEAGGDQEKDDDEKGEKKSESRRGKINPALQQLTEEVRQLKAEKAALDLKAWITEECGKAKVAPDRSLLEGLYAMRDKAQITKHLQWLAGRIRQGSGPRSQSPGQYMESRQPKDAKEFASLITS